VPDWIDLPEVFLSQSPIDNSDLLSILLIPHIKNPAPKQRICIASRKFALTLWVAMPPGENVRNDADLLR
jgi:hypothetical protein